MEKNLQIKEEGIGKYSVIMLFLFLIILVICITIIIISYHPFVIKFEMDANTLEAIKSINQSVIK